jgi:hypothetical protein
MSRNSQKFSPPKTEQKVPPQNPAAEKRNQINNAFGLSFVVPTEEVPLPSQGKYYPKSSPLYGVDKVEIKHMTAKEEDLLANQNLKDEEFKVYDKLIDSLLMNPQLQASDFLEEDKVAVLLSARTTGYGDDFVTEVYCQECKKPTKHEFDLALSDFSPPNFESEYDPENNVFLATLPKTKIRVKLVPINEEIQKDLEEERKQKEKYNIPYNQTVSTINKIVISANDVSDASEIAKLSEALPAIDAKYILEFSNSSRPFLTTRQPVQCSGCKSTTEQEAPISWAFFRTEF